MEPIALAREVERRYRRYLRTTFYFRDPDLRASFEQALESGHLSRGPYLEATPVFERGEQAAALFQSLLGQELDQGFLKLVQEKTPRLYQHQEDAVRAMFQGRNVVVATGTGSGKTEAFLYPILLHLHQECLAGELCPGVRALILYPMNALANDQRERLGEICRRLEQMNSVLHFTFGQYVGETPEDENDSGRHAREHVASRLPGELVLRSEMRENPPHILLTNYSMLEYLLLRPADTPLFDDGRARWWTFLVLDEAHQYRGSRGIEMAMLIRRLKRRLRDGGRSGPFRCMATSASLSGGEGDRGAIARFASDLFGEEFSDLNVILGQPEAIPEGSTENLPPRMYALLRAFLRGEVDVNLAELAKAGVSLAGGEDPATIAGALLQTDRRATRLRRLIAANPSRVDEVGSQLFEDLPSDDRVPALGALIDVLLRAKDPHSGAPLLSARYHLFLRSLEGAFVSYWPEKRVYLDRKVGDEAMAFEVALCRECGQHYFVGPKDFRTGKLVEAIRDPSNPRFGATFLRPLKAGEEEVEEQDGDKIPEGQILQLCTRCGEVSRERPKCGHNSSIRVAREEPAAGEDRADQLARCGACAYSAGGRDPVREVVHGTDGPNAVVATTLYQKLPENRKKVLAFADGRQEAAFFAWYLEDSYRDILGRNLLLTAVKGLHPLVEDGLSLREAATELRNLFQERRIYPPATGDVELRREAWLRVYREYLTEEPRLSLEGVGLIQWSIKWPKWFRVPEVLMGPSWALTEEQARGLVLVVLDSLRRDAAVELRSEGKVSLNWADLGLHAPQTRVRIGQPKGKRDVRSWDGKAGKRVQLLAKLIKRMEDSISEENALQQAVETARAVWDSLRQSDEDAPSSNDRLLLPVGDARRLNPDWWRVRLITGETSMFQCDSCSRLHTISVQAVCPRHQCTGSLKQITESDLQPGHYRSLYEEDLPGKLRVEEHTAQLDKEKAREFQREFRNGTIHVLSCSTTFELGVDLGDLDTIFLRNVPPEAFNYAQRVGRAGRRSGYPGFAITYCRRAAHDLYHFTEPRRMLSGRVRAPALSLHNQKIITRHVAATALSHFFRTFPERFETVERLFGGLDDACAVADLTRFLQDHRDELEQSFRTIVPAEVLTPIGLTDGSWIDKVAGDDSRFSLAQAEITSDYLTVKKYETGAAAKGDYDDAKWAKRRANEMINEEVLSFLSRKAVIPKYGFPVDVVELDTQRTQHSQEAMEVSLQRDLAIAVAEFAPTSKLVANKRMWTSYGLKRVAEKEWPSKLYKRCPRHNVFYRWARGDPEPPTPCGDRLTPSQYVIPRFGFVTDRDKPKEPTSRPARVFTTRPYFAAALGPDPGTLTMPRSVPLITIRRASPGLMVVLCEGRRGEGFYICMACGAGFRHRQKTHKTHYGQDCHGTLEQVSLAQEFETDIVQLQFHTEIQADPERIEPVWVAYSLAYAMVEGAAEVLEVPSTDLSATASYGGDPYHIPPIILYDNVPGGAGLVARLEGPETLLLCLEAAHRRVKGECGCDVNASCYGCLRSYRNQFAHQHLQRGPVLRYLETLLSGWH